MAKQQRRGWNGGVAWVCAVLAGAAAFVLARQTASPAPLGAALPIPHAQYFSDLTPDKSDFLKKRIAKPWLEFLAAEPDGTIPLRYPFESIRGGFTIRHPMGATIFENSPDVFAKTTEDALCTLNYDQPLRAIRYLMPTRKRDEKVTEYVARAQYELSQRGSQLIAGHTEREELPRYRFEHFEFTGMQQTTNMYHVWYVGPLGRHRVLVLEFLTTPELIEQARPQIEKILQSFRPSLDLAEVMLLEDPNYGEWAGTPYVGAAREQQALWDKQDEETAAKAAAAQPGPKSEAPGAAAAPPSPPKRK